MMKEQVQVPFDSRDGANEKDKADKPKALARPMVAKGLDKLKPLRTAKYMRCNLCSDPGCDAPHMFDGKDGQWRYFDEDMVPLPARSGPTSGPRFLPGEPGGRGARRPIFFSPFPS